MRIKAALLSILGSGMVLSAAPVLANDLEGQIDSIDRSSQSFVVQGIRFYVDERTDYDDGLRQFADLQVGQRVEVDFDWRDGRHIAEEIELDD